MIGCQGHVFEGDLDSDGFAGFGIVERQQVMKFESCEYAVENIIRKENFLFGVIVEVVSEEGCFVPINLHGFPGG